MESSAIVERKARVSNAQAAAQHARQLGYLYSSAINYVGLPEKLIDVILIRKWKVVQL